MSKTFTWDTITSHTKKTYVSSSTCISDNEVLHVVRKMWEKNLYWLGRLNDDFIHLTCLEPTMSKISQVIMSYIWNEK